MTDILRYPIGPWQAPSSISLEWRARHLEQLAALPAELAAAVSGLTDEQLATPYRPGGWTVRQVVHHVADSHLNGYLRHKFALTEDRPTIKPYDENAWAALPDTHLDVEVSLRLIAALHTRWHLLLRALPSEAFQRRYRHPEAGEMTLDVSLANYAWHGRHHVAHITSLRSREGWD